MELIVTDTNSSNDSTGKAFGLSGNNYLYPLCSFMGSAVMFMLFYQGFESSLLTSLLFSLPVFLLGTLFMLFLVEGKPRGYAEDFIENLMHGGNWTKSIDTQPKHPTRS